MPFDEAQRDSIRALRNPVLKLCENHPGEICAPRFSKRLFMWCINRRRIPNSRSSRFT